MRDLTIPAANGTETDDDRSNLQDEITQLQDELDLSGKTSLGGDAIKITAAKYGEDNDITIKISFDKEAGNEECVIEEAAVYTAAGGNGAELHRKA